MSIFLSRIFWRKRTGLFSQRLLYLKFFLSAAVKSFKVAYMAQPYGASGYNAENLYNQCLVGVQPKGKQSVYKKRETGYSCNHTYRNISCNKQHHTKDGSTDKNCKGVYGQQYAAHCGNTFTSLEVGKYWEDVTEHSGKQRNAENIAPYLWNTEGLLEISRSPLCHGTFRGTAKENAEKAQYIVCNEEYKQQHIEGAILLPLGKITEESVEAIVDNKDSVIIVYCQSGNRSNQAVGLLNELGYTKVYDLGIFNV